MSFSQRLQKILSLGEAIGRHRETIVDLAVKDLRFTVRDNRMEAVLAQDNLGHFQETESFLSARAPLAAAVPVSHSHSGKPFSVVGKHDRRQML